MCVRVNGISNWIYIYIHPPPHRHWRRHRLLWLLFKSIWHDFVGFHRHAMRCDALQLWLWREVGQVQILCWYFLINLISIDDGAKSSAYITWKLHYTFPIKSPFLPPFFPSFFCSSCFFSFFIACEKAQPKSLRMQSASEYRRVWGRQRGSWPFDFHLCVGGARLAGYLSFTYDKHSVVYCEKDSLAWAHNVLKDIRSDCSFECRHTFTSCRVKQPPTH